MMHTLSCGNANESESLCLIIHTVCAFHRAVLCYAALYRTFYALTLNTRAAGLR